jgi:hypothetical protein
MFRLGTMTYVYNPSNLTGRDQEDGSWRPALNKKLAETPSQQKSWACWCLSMIPTT